MQIRLIKTKYTRVVKADLGKFADPQIRPVRNKIS